MSRILAVAAALVVAVGCAPKQKIKYDLDTVAAAATTTQSSLDVGVLVDIRAEDRESAILFANDHSAKVDGKALCLNAEQRYEPGTVANQVSSAIAAHLEKRGAFRAVTVGSGAGDYRLSGKLRRFYGVQNQSTSAKVGAAFGLIGALATAGAKTPGTVRIALVDLELQRADGTVVRKLPDVEETYEGELAADAYCWVIYRTVNERLRAAVDKLAEQVEHAVVQGAAPAAAPTATR